VNSGIESYFQEPLKGITVSGFHSVSDFIVNVALNSRLISDLDNFGDKLQFKSIELAIFAEISYFECFF
jgi:hypothetical protein